MEARRLRGIIAIAIASIVAIACAKQITLTGGAKDVKPPEAKECTPANGSTNFSEKHITVRFNEYISLNNVASKLIVSPPMDEKPTAVVSGKKLKIKIDPSKLKPNTTYCLNFNDAVVDINEGNAMNSFVYAFSTGSEIDSLEFAGTIYDAFTRKPVEDAWVLLHSEFSDTAVATITPDYITKVDKNGNFHISFVAEKDYKIFALRDNNSNFKFDLPEESIAFLDTVFRPTVEVVVDTVPVKDSLNPDSVNIVRKYNRKPDDVKMLLFKENKTPQFISSSKRIRRNYFEMVFNFKQYEKYNFSVPGDSAIYVWAKENPDTVFLWIKDTSLIASDTLKILAEYTDPAFPDSVHNDTLKFRKQDKLFADTTLTMKLAKDKMPNADYHISFSLPIESFDTAKIHMFAAVDTIFEPMGCSVVKDSANPLRLNVIADVAEGNSYKLVVDSAFATCIYGFVNNLDSVVFLPRREADFGALKILFSTDKTYVIELVQNEKVMFSQISSGGMAKFVYLQPGKYDIRVIEDENENGRWDTGDYSKNLQPEKVFYYPGGYDIRSSWEHEITWENKE